MHEVFGAQVVCGKPTPPRSRGEGKATVETCCKCSIKQDAAIPPKSLECPLRVQGMRIQSMRYASHQWQETVRFLLEKSRNIAIIFEKLNISRSYISALKKRKRTCDCNKSVSSQRLYSDAGANRGETVFQTQDKTFFFKKVS